MAATKTFSRRRMIAAMGALPVAALAAPTIAHMPSVDRSAWDRAFAAMERARAASDADDIRHEPIWRRFEAASEAVPHVTLTSSPGDPIFERTLTTAKWEDMNEARNCARSAYAGGPYRALCRDIIAANEARDAEIHRIGERSGYHASADQQEAFCEAQCDAEAALMVIPAPDHAALLWKLEHLYGPTARSADGSGGSYSAEWTNAFMDDARRLLSGEA